MDYYIIFLIIIILYLLFTYNNNLVKTMANNNKIYYTQRNKSKIAANKLAKIDDFIAKLTIHLLEDNKNHIMIQKNLKKKLIIKELPANSRHVAYIVNKTKLHICLRNNNNKFINQYNRIYFVVMHELAHKITKSIGHTDEFWKNFKLIIETSIKHKLYKYRNYFKDPVKYCGININSSPYIKGGNSADDLNLIVFLFIGILALVSLYFIYNKNSITISNTTSNKDLNVSQYDCNTFEPPIPRNNGTTTNTWGEVVKLNDNGEYIVDNIQPINNVLSNWGKINNPKIHNM